jgi:hypothetical protein
MATFNSSTGVIDGSVSPAVFFKADVLALADGTAVSSVADAASGTNWVQATSTKQPLFKTAIFGTKPSLRFDGTDDTLVNTAGSASNRSTVVLLLKPTTTITTASSLSHPFSLAVSNAGQAVGVCFGSTTGSLTNEIVLANSPQGGYSAWTQSGASIVSTAPHILTFRWNATTTRYDIFRDGGSNLTNAVVATPGLANSTVSTLASTTQNAFPFGGDIGVALIYSAVLTDAQKAAAHSYLKDVWGATAADYDAGWNGGTPATGFGKGFFSAV